MQNFIEAYNSLGDDKKRVIQKLISYFLEESNDNKEWISVNEAAFLMGVSSPTIYKKISDGVLRSRNVGERKTVVLRSDILSLIKEA